VADVSNNRYGRRVYQGSAPPFWDHVTASFPTSTTELRTYSSTDEETGALEIRAIYLLTYADASKKIITSAVKTFGE
jgi:hypothetical protein